MIETDKAYAKVCPFFDTGLEFRGCLGPACMAWRDENTEKQVRLVLKPGMNSKEFYPVGWISPAEAYVWMARSDVDLEIVDRREPSGFCGMVK